MTTWIRAEFHGEGAGEAPLTWGQRGMWDTVTRNAPGQFNIGRRFTVPGPGVSVPDAADAVARLVARHESLRTHILVTDGEPCQVLASSGELPLELVEAGGDATAAAASLLSRLVKGGFDHSREWPVRVGMVTADDRVRVIVLVFCHVVADWPATEIVQGDLRRLLAGDADLPAPGQQPLELARRQHGGPDAKLTRRAVTYWSESCRRIPPRMFDPVGPAHHPPYQEATLNSRAADAAVQLIGARHRVSTSTVLLAVTAALAGAWTGHSTCAVSVVASNRFRAGLQDMVSMLSQLGLFVLDVAGRPSFDDLVRRASPAVLRAYWHAYYDQAERDRAIAAVSQERGTEITPYCCFNDLRDADDAATMARTATVADESAVRAALADTTMTWAGQTEYIRCRFCLGVRDTLEQVPGNAAPAAPAGRAGAAQRTLLISLRADTRCLPPGHIEGFLRDLERLLVDAAFGEVRVPAPGAALAAGHDRAVSTTPAPGGKPAGT